jgi:hypothetical protein
MNVFGTSLGDSYAIVGSCINCTTPVNLLATIALIFFGVGLAGHFTRRDAAGSNSATAGRSAD